MLTKNSLRLRILLVLLLIIVLNVLFARFFVRLDFTSDKRYTLSKATKSILKDIDEPVTITAYFTKDLPAQFESVRSDFEDMLIEYANLSGGNVEYQFIDPNESEEEEQKVIQEGIQPQIVTIRESDQAMQKRVYMGAKLQYGETAPEIIPAIQPQTPIEYTLSTAIKKMSGKNKPKIGFIGGHGETALSSLNIVQNNLSVLYNAETITLNDSVNLDQYKTLVLLAPTDSFTQAELQQLDGFLATGKGLLIAMNRVNGDLQTQQGTAINTMLESWLAQKGVNVNPNFVIDEQCGSITVQMPQQTVFGTMNVQQQVRFPYLPVAQKFADHPITKGIEQVVFPFVSSIDYTGDQQWTSLARTSRRSGMENTPLSFNIDLNNLDMSNYNFFTSDITMAGALEGNLAGNTPSKMVVFADADFISNGEQQAQQMRRMRQNAPVDQLSLFENAVDWLSDDTGLTELRTKAVFSRPLYDMPDESTRLIIKLLNLLLPIILIIGYGLIRMQSRRSQRLKWAAERYDD